MIHYSAYITPYLGGEHMFTIVYNCLVLGCA